LQQQSLMRQAANNLPKATSTRQNVAPDMVNEDHSSSGRPAQKASHGKSVSSNRTDSHSLRKFASYHSGMTRHGGENTIAKTLASGSAQRISKGVDSVPQQRMLRRRPGGDLRANENVHDLEQIIRPRSTGSIATFSESVRGSGMLSRQPRNTTSHIATVDAQNGLAEEVIQRIPSLVRSLSQPALRPSFEAAVAEFARIPDDEGGDIEATILKLEGKYRKNQAKAVKSESKIEPWQDIAPDVVGTNLKKTTDELPNDSLFTGSSTNLGVTTPARSQGTSHRDNMTLSVTKPKSKAEETRPGQGFRSDFCTPTSVQSKVKL
ncbi:MAG: hypothetical protein Q9164_007752, partial [Protoblastenia rupestris]